MIYTAQTKKAMQLAYDAHHGQADKSGVPYIFHPLHLAEQATDETACCVALLHDVVEDTAVTLEQLEEIFPPDVTEAVRLLTHREGIDYFDYVRAIRKNPIARQVKLWDLAHNSDPARCASSGLPPETLQQLKAKYEKAFVLLMDETL